MCNRNYLGRALKERVVTESQKACCLTFYSYHWLWVFMFPPVSRCRHFLICSVSFFVSMRVLFIVILLVQHQWLFLFLKPHANGLAGALKPLVSLLKGKPQVSRILRVAKVLQDWHLPTCRNLPCLPTSFPFLHAWIGMDKLSRLVPFL